MSKGLLKLLESMKYHSWKYIARLKESWVYLSIFLVTTDRFVSVQRMKLRNGTVISEDETDVIWNPYELDLID
jgi:hypothetical protein